MFTGIVETIGIVKSFRRCSGGGILSIEPAGGGRDVSKGDSIAVNGACLTVSGLAGSVVEFDVSEETLNKTTTGNLRAGGKVNIERAMRADGRFGGHFVTGHVDGIGRVRTVRRKGEFVEMEFEAGKAILDEMVPKGSVAVDGVSLTVARIDEKGFGISVIPTTLSATTLGKAGAGDAVNIETDIIVKAVNKRLSGVGGLTIDKLKEEGF